MSNLLIDLLNEGDIAEISNFLETNETQFDIQCKILGINPKLDLRYTDLAEIDFTGSDLRGFDFTGADLRGATGTHVTWDETTKFDQSKLDFSIFSHSERIKRIRNENPNLAREFDRITKQDWSTQTIWALDGLASGASVDRQSLVMDLYFKDVNQIVKNNIMEFLFHGIAAKSEKASFLFNIITSGSVSNNSIRSALNLIDRYFYSDRYVCGHLISIAENPIFEEYLRSQALIIATNSDHYSLYITRINALIPLFNNKNIENALIRRFAAGVGKDHLCVVSEGQQYGGLNLTDSIDEARIAEIATKIWLARARQIAAAGVTNKNSVFFHYIDNIEKMPELIKTILKDLYNRGLSLKLTFNINANP